MFHPIVPNVISVRFAGCDDQELAAHGAMWLPVMTLHEGALAVRPLGTLLTLRRSVVIYGSQRNP